MKTLAPGTVLFDRFIIPDDMVEEKDELPDDAARLVYVFERGSQFELLAQNPDAFMWVSPVPALAGSASA